jgi:hypothetical protein
MHPAIERLRRLASDYHAGMIPRVTPIYLGKVGDIFPELAKTRKGIDLSDVHVHLDPTDHISYQDPTSNSIVIGTAPSPPELKSPLIADNPTTDEHIARKVIHELAHAARDKSGRDMNMIDRIVIDRLANKGIPQESLNKLYYNLKSEQTANEAGINLSKKLLKGGGQPIWSMIPPIGGHMLSKAAEGAGIPSAQDTAPIAQLLGLALSGDPGARNALSRIAAQSAKGGASQVGNMVRTLFDPSRFAEAGINALQQFQADPAGSAAYGVGMAGAMMNPEELANALKFGGKALKGAERRIAGRETGVQRRMVEGYEGQATKQPIDLGRSAPDWAESAGDYAAWASKQPDNVLAMHAQYLTDDPVRSKIAQEILHKRGWRGDISDVEHNAQENIGVDLSPYKNAAPTSIWTREDAGGRMLAKAGVSPGPSGLNPAIGQMLNKHFSKLPPGTPIAYNHDRWVQTTKGFTRMEGAPIQVEDLDWILRRPDTPENMVNLIQSHGGTFGTPRRSRAVVANHIYAIGDQATEEQKAWRAAWKAGLTPP